MKKTKLLLAVAIVFAALSFGFKARAQTMVPVILTSISNNYPAFATSATWYVTMHNNSTNVDYPFQTTSYNFHDGAYHVGSVPPGTYTVSVSYSDYSIYQAYFDWNVDTQDGYSRNMYANTDYQLTDNSVVPDDYMYEFNIVMYKI